VVGEGASPAAGPAMPAPIDVLAGDVVDDFQESIRMPVCMVIRFKGADVAFHGLSFSAYSIHLGIHFAHRQPGFIDLYQLFCLG
jgi:hypothetical protein